MKYYPSIFNDVLSPLTPGPSSSNTCAPHRIASLCRQLLGEEPLSLCVVMAENGGYRDTCFSMQSDLAFISGLLGFDLLSFDLAQAYEAAQSQNLHTEFRFDPGLPETPSELSLLFIRGKSRRLEISAVSLGGGEIEINRINGSDLHLDGKSDCQVAFYRNGSVALLPCAGSDACFGAHASTVGASDIDYIAQVSSVYPFPLSGAEPPFSTAGEMLALSKRLQQPLWKLACRYESAVTGADQTSLRRYLQRIYDISLQAMDSGRRGTAPFGGVTVPKAPQYRNALCCGQLIPLGAADWGCLDALSIMEHACGHGNIVCMPTGGSSGVIPAAILHVAEHLNLPEEARLNALLTAGLIGVFFYPTHYTGALGCQAEIGVAVSMAAAALASLLTEDAATIEAAASFGTQSLLGMVCNPVEGYVQVPCFLRNMTAVPTAITCANAALAGMDSLVPLDDAVELMLRTGTLLRPCNRAATWR